MRAQLILLPTYRATMQATMKTLMSQYIHSKHDLADEIAFLHGMVALGFTRQEATLVLSEMVARLNL